MASLLIKNIHSLVQTDISPRRIAKGKDMQHLPVINEAFLLMEGDRIMEFGEMYACPERADTVIDAKGKMVFPCWCDSHTHLVFAGSREQEFADRLKGMSYEEIARRGGGIQNSANLLNETDEEVLLKQALNRIDEVIGYGTGAIEIKSGYGLSVEGELKMLRVIQHLKEIANIPIKATFLGAHVVPQAYKNRRDEYLDLIINTMLPKIADEGLADYIDVFCEKVAFNPVETERLILAGERFGLKAKIHTNQFNSMGGIEASVKNKALSVDHLEVVNDQEISCLKESDTIATLLPTAPFFLDDPYPPARKLIDAGLTVALATDYNPGSSPSGRMPFVLSLACIKMKMTPEEAVNAATLNGATAMEMEHDHGSIAEGKVANVFITKEIPSIAFLPYAFGSDLIDQVIINGKPV
ncbi:imidazolonepropionase [Fulvivirgaceae bacterium BMA10]|uniref:Imidazolonepropionase n=1 Tax=Splendidivirga corallicola TaxID=3051826 RepID=A0ABT8KZ31_9BACT|nr:imidazolonepropionase [Fulvivirgaceae bacterium BMA10]